MLSLLSSAKGAGGAMRGEGSILCCGGGQGYREQREGQAERGDFSFLFLGGGGSQYGRHGLLVWSRCSASHAKEHS